MVVGLLAERGLSRDDGAVIPHQRCRDPVVEVQPLNLRQQRRILVSAATVVACRLLRKSILMRPAWQRSLGRRGEGLAPQDHCAQVFDWVYGSRIADRSRVGQAV